MNKQWTRSRRDRMVSGVCGGLAELMDVPSWLIRVIVVLAALSGELMLPLLVAYGVLACVLKESPQEGNGRDTVEGQPGSAAAAPGSDGIQGRPGGLWALVGAALVAWGGLMLVREIFHISLSRYVLPVLLIAAGAAVIVWALRKKQ